MNATHWTTLSEVPHQPVKWLWEGRVPLGKVTLLDGEPGFGKSLLVLDLAARVSQGLSMPMVKGAPLPAADVLLFNGDDNLADTVRPRLEEAGADLARIRVVDHRTHADELKDMRPALIVIDPLSAYLCLESGTPPRQVMRDLSQLARETNAAVVVVQYLPRNGSWTAEIFDSARSVLTLTNIGHNRRRLALTKSNLRPLTEVHPLVCQLEHSHDAVKVSGWSDGL